MKPPRPTRLGLLTLALLFSIARSSYGAEGVVVARDVNLYKKADADSKGGTVIATLQVGDILLPARENKGQVYVTDTSCFSFHQCGDHFDDALNPSKYFVLAFLGKDRGGWEKGWVDKSACEKFNYEPTFRKVTCSADTIWDVLEGDSYAKGALLKMDEIRFRDFKPPQISNTRAFAKPFSQVWTAIVQVLAERQIPFELVDKDSGLITTKPVPDPLTNTMVCATVMDMKNMVTFNIFAKDGGSDTEVRINASFGALRDDHPIQCYSNGTLEEWLFGGIAKVAGP